MVSPCYFAFLVFAVVFYCVNAANIMVGIKRNFKSIMHKVPSAIVSSILPVLIAQSAGATDTYKHYENNRYHTSIDYPSSWSEKEGELSGGRILEAFVDPLDSDNSVSIVFTAIPGDYTRLTSFGGQPTLQEYLLPKGEGVKTDIVAESIKGNAYLLEYIISAPSAPVRHVQSIFALRPAESIVGLTLQSKEENFEKFKNVFKDVLSSFRFDEESNGANF